jgi:hypothetical protein
MTPAHSPPNSPIMAQRSVPFKDTHDGLRGFEVTNPDGYVLIFGRPR